MTNESVIDLVESGLYLLPSHMHDGVRDYYYHGYKPGSFLSALLCNDFMGTVGHADHMNIAHLVQWAQFLYSFAPTGSYGSPEAFKNWLEQFVDDSSTS